MSKIIEQVKNRELAHIVECNGKLYYVDTALVDVIFEPVIETMVFKAEEREGGDIDKKYQVLDWEDLWCERTTNLAQKHSQHIAVINELENYLYYDNDVATTEAVFDVRQSDFTARKILAEITGDEQ